MGVGASGNNMTDAQRLLNIIARWVTECNKRTIIASLMDEAGWLLNPNVENCSPKET